MSIRSKGIGAITPIYPRRGPSPRRNPENRASTPKVRLQSTQRSGTITMADGWRPPGSVVRFVDHRWCCRMLPPEMEPQITQMTRMPEEHETPGTRTRGRSRPSTAARPGVVSADQGRCEPWQRRPLREHSCSLLSACSA